jgi:hypothetical protein
MLVLGGGRTMEESLDEEEVLVGDGGIGISVGSRGGECMRSEMGESDDSWEFGDDGGMLNAERFALFVTGRSEGRGAIFRILLDWRKASVDE